jgi:phospholipase D1/2
MVGKTHHVLPAEQHTGSDDAKRNDKDASGDGSPDHRSFKDKLRHPFPELRDKLKETHLYDVKVGAIHLKHRIGKFENLVNSNHRHDEPHEQATDAKRTKIAEGHRFQSFAPERNGNRIKWYIDGRDYFHAVSVALERAKEVIYIEDWWLSPELFLRRPPFYTREWRIDQVLKRAAERGVKIYVIVYKEVEAAITCNSAHTKHALEALCDEKSPGYKNIVVMRHPDHNVFENAGDMTFYWAHHEKFIVIDYNMAFIGGLDLCFGRWDTKTHPLSDVHPAGVENEIFPGQDFNNNRIMDFQGVDDWKSNELSKADYGRMPWHDTAMGVIGPCIYDIAEHFVLRWNFCKRDKYKRDDRYDWLTLTGRSGEDEDLIGVQRPKHPVGDYVNHPFTPLQDKAANPHRTRTGHVEVASNERLGERSAGQVSAGAIREQDDDEIFHDAHENVDEHGYLQNQHERGHGLSKELRQHGYHRPHMHTDKTLPHLPEDAKYDNEPPGSKQENDHMTGNAPKKEGFATASGGYSEKYKGYESQVVDPNATGHLQNEYGSVHAQLVRSSADWSSGILTEQSIQNAYCEVIREAKHFVYIENQFFITATGQNQAPVHNQIGAAIVDAIVRAGKEGRKFRVIVVIPTIPGFAGDLRDSAALGTRAIMDYQYKSINRGEDSIFGKVKAAGIDPTEYMFIFNLRSYDRLNKTPALKKQEEESGVSYQEVQRAQAEEVMSTGIHGGEGDSSSSEGEADSEGEEQKVKTSAKKRRFESKRKDAGLDGLRAEDAPGGAAEGIDHKSKSVDSIAKDAMLNEPTPAQEAYAGRHDNGEPILEEEGGRSAVELEKLREQENENFVQEELYIHGKVSHTNVLRAPLLIPS